MKKSICILISLLTGLFLHAQDSERYMLGDTVITLHYYSNGKLEIKDVEIKDVPTSEFSLKKWYAKNGTLKLYDSIDAAHNILYIAIYRKDGSIEYDVEERQPYYTFTYRDANNVPQKIYSGKLNERMVREQTFSKGSLTSDTTYDRFAIIGLDTLTYYSSITLKGKREVTHFEMDKDSHFTIEKHIRMVYDKDSLLVSEALYSPQRKYIGYYLEYFPDGSIKTIGNYDKRGYKDGDWYTFDEQGNLIFRARYFRSYNLLK